MHNLKEIRQNIELFEKKIKERNSNVDLKSLIKVKVNYKQVGSDRLTNAISVLNEKENFIAKNFLEELKKLMHKVYPAPNDEKLKEKAKSKWSQIEALVGAQPRLEQVASDIIKHFENYEYPGWDITSYDKAGNEIFIEVKSTKGNTINQLEME